VPAIGPWRRPATRLSGSVAVGRAGRAAARSGPGAAQVRPQLGRRAPGGRRSGASPQERGAAFLCDVREPRQRVRSGQSRQAAREKVAARAPEGWVRMFASSPAGQLAVRGGNRGPPDAVRVALGEVSSRTIRSPCSASTAKNELSGNGPVSPAASRKPTCPVVVQSMPDMVPSNPDGSSAFSAVS
jgi:hypothetical protein